MAGSTVEDDGRGTMAPIHGGNDHPRLDHVVELVAFRLRSRRLSAQLPDVPIGMFQNALGTVSDANPNGRPTMNENTASPAEPTSRRYREMDAPADFFIKGSVTISIAAFIFGQSEKTLRDGGLWIACGMLMMLASGLILCIGVMALVNSASAFEAMLFSRSTRNKSNEHARNFFAWFFAILVTATLIGLSHRLGFVTFS